MRSRRHFEITASHGRMTVSTPRRYLVSSFIGSLVITAVWWLYIGVVASESLAAQDPWFHWFVAFGVMVIYPGISGTIGIVLGRRLEVNKERNVVRRNWRIVSAVDTIELIEIAPAFRISPFNWPIVYAVKKDQRRVALMHGEGAAGPFAFVNTNGHSAMSIKNELTSTAKEIADYLGVPLKR